MICKKAFSFIMSLTSGLLLKRIRVRNKRIIQEECTTERFGIEMKDLVISFICSQDR